MTVCECCVCLGFFLPFVWLHCVLVLSSMLLCCTVCWGLLARGKCLFCSAILFPCYWMHVLHGVDVIVPKDNDRDFCSNPNVIRDVLFHSIWFVVRYLPDIHCPWELHHRYTSIFLLFKIRNRKINRDRPCPTSLCFPLLVWPHSYVTAALSNRSLQNLLLFWFLKCFLVFFPSRRTDFFPNSSK